MDELEKEDVKYADEIKKLKQRINELEKPPSIPRKRGCLARCYFLQ